MATIYVRDANDKYHKIDIGRSEYVPIYFDWGGCTGDLLNISVNELWTEMGEKFEVIRRPVITQMHNGVLKIDRQKVEVLDA